MQSRHGDIDNALFHVIGCTVIELKHEATEIQTAIAQEEENEADDDDDDDDDKTTANQEAGYQTAAAETEYRVAAVLPSSISILVRRIAAIDQEDSSVPFVNGICYKHFGADRHQR
mmetsp:Transcript_21349/g.60993  ORF Transcript_21349/g.60993 Transcript_21349/m.60993 type:complete len:116 (+) Transcript_21349:986-1333(+)